MTEPKPAETQAEPGASIPPGFAIVRSFTCPAAEPMQSLVFEFHDDQLVSVEATFSKEVAGKITGGELAKLVWAKYFADRGMVEELRRRQVRVLVFTNSGGDGSPEFNAIGYSGSTLPLLAVKYLDDMLRQQILDRAKARRQQALDKNAAELNLGESL